MRRVWNIFKLLAYSFESKVFWRELEVRSKIDRNCHIFEKWQCGKVAARMDILKSRPLQNTILEKTNGRFRKRLQVTYGIR